MVHIPEEENIIVYLKKGWTIHAPDHSTIKSIESVPTTMKTNQVTTFMLSLHVPKTNQIYSLDLDGIHQPFELWVNGQLIKNSPMPAPNKFIHFYVETETVDLKLLITPVNDQISFLQTPTLGQIDSMQNFLIKNLVIVLIALICLTIVGVYSIFLYFSKQRQVLHLQIGLYFLLVSGGLFLSSAGIGSIFLPLSNSVLVRLKTISGILAVVPLYFFAISINRLVISKVKLYFLTGAVACMIALIFIVPTEMYHDYEIIIWSCLICILFIYIIKLVVYFLKNGLFGLENIIFINTLFYLFIYLSSRLYYNLWGTDLQTNLWLICFAISICMHLTLHQKQLLRDLERSKRDVIQSKISFFNAQIKPHFIYIALSNIMALCYTDNLKAAHLLGKFSTYLRLIFENNTQNDWISLEKELTLVDAYVEIEKARFPDKINYRLEVEPHIKSFKIPPLSIQPFVENAIRHGLFNKEDTGTISVKIEHQESGLVITIQDDGIGMTPQTVDTLLKGKALDQGIGISNVRQRLSFIATSEFAIHSTLNEGTSVRIKIPLHTYS